MAKLPSFVDLSSRFKFEIYDQGDLGSSAACAMANVIKEPNCFDYCEITPYENKLKTGFITRCMFYIYNFVVRIIYWCSLFCP